MAQCGWHFSSITLFVKLNKADLREVENKRARGEQPLHYCDFLQQKGAESSGSFLRAHLDSHFSALKGSINRGALLYLPSLPTKSFFHFCVKKKKKANKREPLTFRHSQIVFPPALSLLYASYFVLLPVSPFHLIIYYTYMYLTGSSCHSLPPLSPLFFLRLS